MPSLVHAEPYRALRKRATEAINTQLDAARVSELRAQGAAMTEDQATVYALDAIAAARRGGTASDSSIRRIRLKTHEEDVVVSTFSRRGRMMDGPASQPPPRDGTVTSSIGLVEGPVWVAWCEATLTRAKELEALRAWVLENNPQEHSEALASAVTYHLEAARQAAKSRARRILEAANQDVAAAEQEPKKRFRMFRNGPLLERARSNLDAAEAEILNFAPPDYVLGQMPSLLNHVQCHLIATDPRRQEFERIARKLGVKDPDHPALENKEPGPRRQEENGV